MFLDVTPAMVQAFHASTKVQQNQIVSLQAGIRAAILASKSLKTPPVPEFHFDLFNALDNERVGYMKTRAEPRAGEKMMDGEGRTFVVQEVLHAFVSANAENSTTARTMAVFATPIASALALIRQPDAPIVVPEPLPTIAVAASAAANQAKPRLSLPTAPGRVLDVKVPEPAAAVAAPISVTPTPQGRGGAGGRKVVREYEKADPRMQYVTASAYRQMSFKIGWTTLTSRARGGHGPRLVQVAGHALGFEKTAFMEWARLSFANVPRSAVERNG